MLLFPKLSFGSTLIAFAFPFLLVTCNDIKTNELKPLVMQDQMIYPIQGYKIMINSLDKNLEGAKPEGDSFNPFGAADSFYTEPTEEGSMSMIQIFAILAFLLSIAGFALQFSSKELERKKKFSVLIASLVLFFLVAMVISVEVGLAHINEKMGDMASSGSRFGLGSIEYALGYGTGFYICFASLASVLLFYLWYLDKNATMEMPIPEEAWAIEQQPKTKPDPAEENDVESDDISKWAPPKQPMRHKSHQINP